MGRMGPHEQNVSQCCVGAKRFILHEKIADEFLSRFRGDLAKFVPGDPTDPKTTLAPLSKRTCPYHTPRRCLKCQREILATSNGSLSSSFLTVAAQMAWINKRPTTSITAQVTP
jgi:aldehyde dehydrogenase family protein